MWGKAVSALAIFGTVLGASLAAAPRDRVLRRILRVMRSRPPDFIAGEPSDPHLKRWFITPSWLRRLCLIYAHEFHRSDDAVPHDHPDLICISWILQTGYYEDQFTPRARRMARRGYVPDCRDDLVRRWHGPGAVIWRWGWTAHRIELKSFDVKDINTTQVVASVPRPITLFFGGPSVREWGFWCPQGWKPWREYIAPTSDGNRVAKRCNE